jgi:tRNA(fMet)-specific endonuclease VapC
MIVLDTDILSLIEWSESSSSQVLRRRFAQHPPAEISTTIISFEEQVRGWTAYIAKAKKMVQEIEAYRRLHRQLKLYCTLAILDFDEVAAVRFQSLKKEFPRHKRSDLKIASIALVHSATLVSRNLQYFQPIPGLIVEDWSR